MNHYIYIINQYPLQAIDILHDDKGLHHIFLYLVFYIFGNGPDLGLISSSQ